MRSNLMTLPQLHRSGQTSLVRLWFRDYRLVVLFIIEICTLFVCYACIDYFSRLPMLSHIQHIFINLLTYRQFYRFFGFSLLSLSQLHRSDRTSLLMIIDQIYIIYGFIYDKQSIVRVLYFFFIKLIGSTFYIDHVLFSR